MQIDQSILYLIDDLCAHFSFFSFLFFYDSSSIFPRSPGVMVYSLMRGATKNDTARVSSQNAV